MKIEKVYLPLTTSQLNTLVIVEMSVSDLQASTIRAFPSTAKRQHIAPTVNVVEIGFIPYKADRQLHVKAKTKSDKPDTYDCLLVFNDVIYEDENTGGNITFTGVDGQEYSIRPLTQNDVQVRCTCLDFYYRFAYFNFMHGALFGTKPPPYAKVPGSTRGPANPLRLPGLCKHIVKVAEDLKRQKFLR